MFLTRIGFGSKAVVTGDVTPDRPAARPEERPDRRRARAEATCAASRSRTSPAPTWCAIRWWRASSTPTSGDRRSKRRRRDADRPIAAQVPRSCRCRCSIADAAPTRALPRAHAAALGRRPRCSAPAELTVRFVDADEGRALNRDYRGKDYATNVLTFAYTKTRIAPRSPGRPRAVRAGAGARSGASRARPLDAPLRAPGGPRHAARAGLRPRSATPTPRRMEALRDRDPAPASAFADPVRYECRADRRCIGRECVPSALSYPRPSTTAHALCKTSQ